MAHSVVEEKEEGLYVFFLFEFRALALTEEESLFLSNEERKPVGDPVLLPPLGWCVRFI